MDESIFYCIEEISNNNDNENDKIEEILKNIDRIELSNELAMPYSINYNENYTVKELMLICDYYGFSKFIKINKLNKEQIVNCIVQFEIDPSNNETVFRRQNLWFYINELKKDKFMKKYILW